MIKKKIILASASPRRRELLTQVGIEHEVCPSSCDERTLADAPAQMVEELSYRKALDVYGRLADSKKAQNLVIGADTVVALDGQILGKPADEQDACRMLAMLQGRLHQVYTGVTLVGMDETETRVKTFHEVTQVTMYPLSEEEIRAYVSCGEPLDKAGAYGIQGRGAAFIKGIDGDYGNVVGLPVGRLCQELKRIWSN